MCARVVRNERGVTLALMAIVMFLTLGMAALAIDYGMVKSAKAEAQRAMDSAALAGGSALLISDPSVDKVAVAKARAKEFARKHTVRGVRITDAEDSVEVDLVNFNVKASWQRSGMGLWFARTFGTSSVGLTATATAHREATNTAICVKPVAIPDIWDNHAHLTGGGGKKGGSGTESEDLNGNHIWDYKDANGNGTWDEGEAEPWTYDPSLGDTYSATVGYGTPYRNAYGTGYYGSKVNDYGRQIMLTTFSPKDASVSSMYYSWGHTTAQTNADSIAAAIRGQRCEDAALNTNYAAANGGKIGPLQAAWADLIATDPSAHWDDQSNTVLGSSALGNWETESPRTVVVALYNPSVYANTPNANTLQFINLAKVWIDQRPCAGAPGTCKAPITARFLGFVNGGGETGTPVGTLVYHLVLIK